MINLLSVQYEWSLPVGKAIQMAQAHLYHHHHHHRHQERMGYRSSIVWTSASILAVSTIAITTTATIIVAPPPRAIKRDTITVTIATSNSGRWGQRKKLTAMLGEQLLIDTDKIFYNYFIQKFIYY